MPGSCDLTVPGGHGHFEAIGDAAGLLHEDGCSSRRAETIGCRLLEQRQPTVEVQWLDRQRKVGLHRLSVVAARHQHDRRPEGAQLGQMPVQSSILVNTGCSSGSCRTRP